MTENRLTPTGVELFEHWQRLPRREGEVLPYWQDLSAGSIAPIMNRAWVLEYHEPSQMIVRYVGSEVVKLAGRDTTGHDFLTSRIAPENRAYMLALYRLTYETPVGTQLNRLISDPGNNHKVMTTTFFPLNSDREESWMLLGVSEMSSTGQLADTAGKADFYSSHLDEPCFFDLGQGLPSNTEIEKLNALKS